MIQGISQSSQVHTRTGIVTSGGMLLPEYLDRKTLIIQNLGTAPLFIKFGESASSSDFDLILKAGLVNDDALGGTVSFDTLSYTGIISVDGTTVRCTATEW